MIPEKTWKKIYRLLDSVSPVPFDCGRICGAACCDTEAAPDGAEMCLMLLPGEEVMRPLQEWATWQMIPLADMDLPETWPDPAILVLCHGAPTCRREVRPMQCRSFPCVPHFLDDGELILIYNEDDLPYRCPLIDGETELSADYVRVLLKCWKKLVKDPAVHDLVKGDSAARDRIRPVKIREE